MTASPADPVKIAEAIPPWTWWRLVPLLCCGIALQLQTYNYGQFSSSPIPSDHRFFLSFTLAGLGNFSPFNGALSGVPR